MNKKTKQANNKAKFTRLEKELAVKKRELKIEASLEKVRSKTMRMRKPDDMLEVCKAISLQLESLSVKEIRNVQTAIFYPQRGTYMNYEYYAKHNKTFITETLYTNHKMHEEFARKMLIGKGEFFKTHIKGKDVKDWIAYQKTTNVFIDKILETASSVNYYWFSLGPVALGISTYSPLTEVEIGLFKRFLKVFELAYQRYLDIEKAIAQTKEAEIQLALERVRTVAMSMNISDDLLRICEVSFKEFQKLGFDQLRNAVIHIPNDEQKFFMDYDYSELTKGAISKIEYGSHPIVDDYLKKIRIASDAYFEVVITEDQLAGWKDFRKKSGQRDDPRLDNATELHYYLFSIGIGDIGISTFKPIEESQITILKRFRNVFDLSYRRYKDITRAEAQAKEAQIEAALERVRSRSLAMHKSDELKEVIRLVLTEIRKLDILAEHAGFYIDYKMHDDMHIWLADPNIEPFFAILPYFDTPTWNSFKKAKATGTTFHTDLLDFKEKNKFYKSLFKLFTIPEEAKQFYLQCKGLAVSTVLLDNVGLYIENFSGTPYTNEENNVLMRFGKVFQQTYTRFLDLQKSEAQAREAQIQLALERVRARTMAMQKSDELSETVYILFQQFRELGVNPDQTTIGIIKEEEEVIEYWVTMYGQPINKVFKFSIDEPNVTKKIFKAWKEGKRSLIIDLQGNALREFMKYRADKGGAAVKPDEKRRIIHVAFFSKGSLIVQSTIERSEESINLLERFASVFEQTYTRFLDLQKVEAQTKEARIEASLERVRAKAMAMHSSTDLSDTMGVLFTELPKLGIDSLRCGVVLLSKKSSHGVFYATATTSESDSFTMIGSGDMSEHPVFQNQYKYWLKNENYFTILKDEELQSYYKALFARLSIPYKPREHKEQTEHGYYFAFSEGMFYAWSEEPYSDIQINILNRFKAIIDLTFRRYLDLQKAEAQAREAQIEVALERVRAKAMAMQSSEDFTATIVAFYHELSQLSFTPRRCGVGIIDKETRIAELSTLNSTEKGESIQSIGKIKLAGHPLLEKVYDNWLLQNEYHAVLQDDEIQEYFNYIGPQIAIPDFSEDQIQYGYYFYFNEGGVYSWTEKKLSDDELQIYRRFTTVLSLTYRRYIDLKEAEARAIESVRQSALDRVRAEIASMRTSDDLNHITPIIWRELKILGVPFFRCGVYIIHEESETVNVYLSTPDGKSLGVLNLAFSTNDITSGAVEHWRINKIYKKHWSKEEFVRWAKLLVEQRQVPNTETYQGSVDPPESLDLHFIPFAQGMLYVGDIKPLTDENLELVRTLAEAFSIAYARYEDFRNLEEAKNKVEVTLNELRSAQAQLVHSEKMASLGELTAGIAHEIKNPLNFVNNFSEISAELLDELKTELLNNKTGDVIQIVESLKQNLEKINSHGKRADSIVKGMLLHSRGTSGEKVLTNINDLLDQYVTLAYHGLRAQDKEFNITIEKDYDKSLEKINVVPQDISRVFLNIINNGCYAAIQKKLKRGDGFNPVLRVSTKNLQNGAEIRIRDNGDGIPKSIQEQVFSPFFTTKPTGEGTGLGLSLSYDIIVKQHMANLTFDTQEGEFTEFIITLPKGN